MSSSSVRLSTIFLLLILHFVFLFRKCECFSIISRASAIGAFSRDELNINSGNLLQPRSRLVSVGKDFKASSDDNEEIDGDFDDDLAYDDGDDDVDSSSSPQSSVLTPEQAEYLLEYSMDSFLRGDYDKPFAENAAAPLPGLSPRETVEMALSSLRQLNDPYPSHGAAVLLRFCAPLSRADRWGGGSSSTPLPFSSGIDTSGRTGTKNENKSTGFAFNDSDGGYSWKEVLRGALTPTMLARRIRASPEFSGLLDWTAIDVTDGAHWYNDGTEDDDEEADDNTVFGVPSSIAYVNVALYFDNGYDNRNSRGGRGRRDRTSRDERGSRRNGGGRGQRDNATPARRVEPTILQFQLRRLNGVWLIESAQKSDPNKLFVASDTNVDNESSDASDKEFDR